MSELGSPWGTEKRYKPRDGTSKGAESGGIWHVEETVLYLCVWWGSTGRLGCRGQRWGWEERWAPSLGKGCLDDVLLAVSLSQRRLF